MSPLVQGERRIGRHDIEQLKSAVLVQQFGIPNGIAPLNTVVIHAMQEHVHLGQRPGASDSFLSVECEAFGAVEGVLDLVGAFQKQ